MELSERAIQALENEGCTSVYEEDWQPQIQVNLRATTPLHVIVTEGSMAPGQNGVEKTYQAGDRWYLAPNQSVVIHTGVSGCRVVIGE